MFFYKNFTATTFRLATRGGITEEMPPPRNFRKHVYFLGKKPITIILPPLSKISAGCGPDHVTYAMRVIDWWNRKRAAQCSNQQEWVCWLALTIFALPSFQLQCSFKRFLPLCIPGLWSSCFSTNLRPQRGKAQWMFGGAANDTIDK